MRIPILILAVALAAVSLAGAEREPPVPLDRKGVVNFSIASAPVRSLIESIVTNGDYDFITAGNVSDVVNLSVMGASIGEALDTISRITGLEYRVEGRIVTLYARGTSSEYTQIYSLKRLSPVWAADYLRPLLAGPPSAGAPGGGGASSFSSLLSDGSGTGEDAPAATSTSILADPDHSQLIITARPSAHRRIEKVLGSLDAERSAEPRLSRVFELKYVSSSLFRNVLKFELPGFQDNQYMDLNDGPASGAPGVSSSSSGRGSSSGAGRSSSGSGGSGRNTGFSSGASTPSYGGTGGYASQTAADGGTPGAGTPQASVMGAASQAGTSNTRRVLINDTEKNLAKIERLSREIDRPLKQIFAEVTLMKINRTRRSQNGSQVEAVARQAPWARQLPVGRILSTLGLDGSSGPSSESNMQLRFGTIGPEDFSVLFNYLKNQERGEVLASPKMLVQEGQEARINITQQYPVFETEVTEGVPVTKVTFTDVGTMVRFTPAVFADGTIQLTINPEISSVLRTVSFGTNGEVPVKDSNIVSTVLNVMSGETAIIGGLRAKTLKRSLDSQPLLSGLPVVGELFKRRVDTDETYDLIFLLTPRIVGRQDDMLVRGNVVHQPVAQESCAMSVSWGNDDRVQHLPVSSPDSSHATAPVGGVPERVGREKLIEELRTRRAGPRASAGALTTSMGMAPVAVDAELRELRETVSREQCTAATAPQPTAAAKPAVVEAAGPKPPLPSAASGPAWLN